MADTEHSPAPPLLRKVAFSPRSWTRLASFAFSLLTLAFLCSMVGLFAWQSFPVWKQEGIGYVTGEKWYFRQQEFGALAMIYGTFVVSLVALLLAAPVGVASALFTVEILPAHLRLLVKATVELLAGVPSVVYGLLGILFLRNWIYIGLERFDLLSGDTLLTAGILLGIMILPTVMTLSDDALVGVASAQRLAARALGLTRAETGIFVGLAQSWRGILTALLLAMGRALGETIAVFLVVGRRDNALPENFFSLQALIEAGQTLTSKLGGSETNISYGDPLHWGAITGLGLILLVIVAAITWLSVRFTRRKGEFDAPQI